MNGNFEAESVQCTAARNQVLFPADERSRQGPVVGSAEVRRGEKRGNNHKERCAEEEVVHDVTIHPVLHTSSWRSA
jgi:hypothetical protein